MEAVLWVSLLIFLFAVGFLAMAKIDLWSISGYEKKLRGTDDFGSKFRGFFGRIAAFDRKAFGMMLQKIKRDFDSINVSKEPIPEGYRESTF